MRRFKSKYTRRIQALAKERDHGRERENVTLEVKSLPARPLGRPLFGEDLDKATQEHVTAMRTVGGVVNTTIVMAASEETVSAHNMTKLSSHAGYIQISNTWALNRMECEKKEFQSKKSACCMFQ